MMTIKTASTGIFFGKNTRKEEDILPSINELSQENRLLFFLLGSAVFNDGYRELCNKINNNPEITELDHSDKGLRLIPPEILKLKKVIFQKKF